MVAAELGRCTLVTGPANSGKSLWAETLALRSQRPVQYLATGPQLPDDADWQLRLQRHRQRRPTHWGTLEVGAHLPEALAGLGDDALVLIDSLGTWVAAELDSERDAWQQRIDGLLEAVQASTAPLILVAEETTWGVVPASSSGLRFRDRLGGLLQQLMPYCDQAYLVLHGRVLDLLALSQPLSGERPTDRC